MRPFEVVNLKERLSRIEQINLLGLIHREIAWMIKPLEDRVEEDPFFSASPAAQVDMRDLKILRSVPDMLRSIELIPGPKGDKGDAIKGDPGTDGKDGKDGLNGKDGKDGKSVSTPQIVQIAKQEVRDHEERFPHELLHSKYELGSVEISEQGMGDGKVIMYKEGKLHYVLLPKVPSRTRDDRSYGVGLDGLTFIDKETPSGSINDSNVTFTLAHTPVTGSVHLFKNGLLQDEGAGQDYTISGGTITMATAPAAAFDQNPADKLRASYRT